MTTHAQLQFIDPVQIDEAADVIVDVRDRRSYEAGHIPGAINIPYDVFRETGSVLAGKLPDSDRFAALRQLADISADDSVVAYDGDNGVYAARFLLTAAVFGHEGQLSLVDGGFARWRTDPETGEPATEPPRQPLTTQQISETEEQIEGGALSHNEELVVSREAVEEAVEADTTIIDTRTPTEYAHAHIPGAVNLGWEELLQDGTLRPEAALESLLTERGISRDDDLLLYCNTARRLSHTFVVLAHLGFENVTFYEGSLTDWIRADAPDWNPLSLYENVRAVAQEGFDALPEALGEDIFSRLHLIGLYTQKQDGYFMLRTKVPCGTLTAEQARTFGEIATEFATTPESHGGATQNPEFGDGYLDITTRQGLQLHWIEIEDMPEIWDRYEEVGVTTIQASGNTLRNVVVCPATGFGEESLPVDSLGESIANRFEGDRELANLPRKLKVSLSGCDENCARAEIQDIGFLPAEKDGTVGFHVKVGGGLSDGPRAASDLGIFLTQDQVVGFTVAVAELFADYGSYLDTAVNRLKFIVEELGVEQFKEQLDEYVNFEFENAGESLTTDHRSDHVGVHQQADGNYYVGLTVPTGRMYGTDLVELADLAEEYGSGTLRTTSNQNLVVPDIPESDLDAFLESPVVSRYSPQAGPFQRGIVTCTGAEFCSYGVIETKTRGLRWARELDEWISETPHVDSSAFPDRFSIHMSGCSASCALPQVGDVGLRGERHRGAHEDVAAADIGLGADLSVGTFIDWVAGSVPTAEIPAALKQVLVAFGQERETDESFPEWVNDRTLSELHDLVTRVKQTEQPAQAEVN